MTTNASTRPKNRFIIILGLALFMSLLAICLLLWKSQRDQNNKLQRLQARNGQLQQDLDSAKLQMQLMKSGDSSEDSRERLEETRQARSSEPAEVEKETLILQEPTVRQTPDGLQVRLQFEIAEGTVLPQDLTLVARVPASGTSRIIDLAPAQMLGDADLGTIVNQAGHLAMIQCTPADLESLAFLLDVSEPVTATVRGSEGVIDFALEITPEGCTVRQL